MGGGDSCSSQDTCPFPSHSGWPSASFHSSPPPPETRLSLPSAFPSHHSRSPPPRGHKHKHHHLDHHRSGHKHNHKLKCKGKFNHHHRSLHFPHHIHHGSHHSPHHRSHHSPHHRHHGSHHSPHQQHITEEIFGPFRHKHHAAFPCHAPPPHHGFFSHPISTTPHEGF